MTPQNEPQLNPQSVFLEQKSGMKDLHSLFGPHCMDTRNHKGLAKTLEVSLYALFISFICVMMLIPNNPEAIQGMFRNTPLTDPIGFVLWVKMSLFISSLVPLFWGLHLSSRRLKGRLISKWIS